MLLSAITIYFIFYCSRLSLPNSVEPLDIETEDPFYKIPGWLPIEFLNSLRTEDVFTKLKVDPNILLVNR